MDIKLITLDLDGTLLNSKKQLSQGNREALCQCCRKGIWIVPCTGRTVDGIPQHIKSIPGVRYAITTNGAVIEDMKEKKPVDTRMLSWTRALEILSVIDCYDVMYDPYIDRRGITEPRFFNHLSHYGLTPELQELVRQTRDVYPNIIDYVKEVKKPVEKINLFFGSREKRQELRAVLEKQQDLLITSSLPLNLEINAPEANKGDALLRLASHLGINREQTMAIGDGENDISMIKNAGIGVAMGNGRKDLLSLADYITDTNDNDGVALAIRHYVFGNEL